MDAPRSDVESCVPVKHARGRKLTLLVALQSVLLTGCLLAALYIYWTNKGQLNPVSQDVYSDVYIKFYTTDEIEGKLLKFKLIQNHNRMNLSDGSRISTECTGPYILHMNICYKSSKDEASGSLQLQVEGEAEDPRCTFELHTSKEVCRGLQSNVYLRKEEKAAFHLHSANNLEIVNVTLGFNYLLGSRCEY